MQDSDATRTASENMLRSFISSTADLVYLKDEQWRHIVANAALCEFFGRSEAEILGRTDFDFMPPEAAQRCRETDIAALKERRTILHEEAIGDRFFETRKFPVPLGNGAWGVGGIIREVTERRRAESERAKLEQQLHQAMKMEAVGRLAGGVAHDFNNLLTAIQGNASLALGELDSPTALVEYLNEVVKASESAAALTRQLLAFSRNQIITPKIVNLNDLILGLQKMLARIIGEDIELRTALAVGLGSVRIDPGQFEQMLVNLVVNARDAMPNGGELLIETHNLELTESYCRKHPGVFPGPYVMLAVSDTGTGMSEEVKRHLFEPFFTTKPTGRGTGLGLATIFGVVKQLGGSIEAYSELGHGTTFRIYLPHVQGSIGPRPAEPKVLELLEGNETILLVEDETAVREYTTRLLGRLSYRVLSASNGEEALGIAEKEPRPIDLLITDVVMPGMNGRELAERLVASQPAMRVLFTSGYTENIIVHHGVLDDSIAFIPKPYTPEAIAQKIRLVLGGAEKPPEVKGKV